MTIDEASEFNEKRLSDVVAKVSAAMVGEPMGTCMFVCLGCAVEAAREMDLPMLEVQKQLVKIWQSQVADRQEPIA
jgi:hypothetical protein